VRQGKVTLSRLIFWEQKLAFGNIHSIYLKTISNHNRSAVRQISFTSTKLVDAIRNPSDFDKIEYAVPKSMIGKILGKDKQVVNQIKAESGSVIRYKKTENEDQHDENGYFIIGGTKEQIEKAIELIEAKISKKPYVGKQDGAPIWTSYRRNFKGQKPPQRTRHKCIRAEGKVVSGNPCPLCKLKIDRNRDINYKDVHILKQFICQHTDQIILPSVTGLCRQQHGILVAEIEKSRNYGLLPFTIPLPNDAPNEYKPVGIPSKTVRIRR